MGVLGYPFDRSWVGSLGGRQQAWGGVGGREKGLNRAGLVKPGMFSVPEEGTRSRTEEKTAVVAGKGSALAVLTWGLLQESQAGNCLILSPAASFKPGSVSS